MPRFYPNIQFSDCWSSVGDITYYHRNGICYFRSKAYHGFTQLGHEYIPELFETPGYGRNPGKMRNVLSVSVPCGLVSDIVFLIQDYRSIWGIDLDAYQVHMRYILLDTVTGYRSQYHSLSTLVTI